MYTQTHNGITK